MAARSAVGSIDRVGRVWRGCILCDRVRVRQGWKAVLKYGGTDSEI
jgi:hypothetical protein